MTSAIANASERTRPPAPESNVKETVEQILIAFILAFIFRCFIVEAFVIPTGSMAPTLLGAHMDFRCPDCGWTWNVNYSGDSVGDDVHAPAFAGEIYAIRCPNCGYKLPRVQAGDEANDATFPAVQYGDRILVQKYLYLLHEPKRWDVVVFKTPDAGSSSVEPYTQNYIKRLTGTPDEAILILDGDVYVSPRKPSRADYAPGDFTIQTKPRDVQRALWRVIYDNDHLPRGLPRTYYRAPTQYAAKSVELDDQKWRQPWAPAGEGWDVSGRVFKFDGVGKDGRLDFDLDASSKKHPMTDWLGYDVSWMVNQDARRNRRTDFFNDEQYPALHHVSDVKLAVDYRRVEGDGPLRLRLTKGEHRFVAELTRTAARLLMARPGEAEPSEIARVDLRDGDGNRRIEFENVDHRVALRIDGREVLATTPAQFAPDVAAMLVDAKADRPRPPASVSIEAADQRAELSHVSLWRDVYYINTDSPSQNYWAMPDNFPLGNERGRIMELGPDEFFVMGDNSMLSSDARVWRSRVELPYERLSVEGGRVPRRFLLGKAFFVYWPAGTAPIASLPGFVPNFGEMRFIH